MGDMSDWMALNQPDETILNGETRHLHGQILTQTNNAVLFRWNAYEKWFPKSRINIVSDNEIEVESWLLDDIN
jgi:hypothetical protein